MARRTHADPLRRSRRAAWLAAVLALSFGVILIVWAWSLQSVAMTAGGVLATVRGGMAVLIVVGIGLSQRHTRPSRTAWTSSRTSS